MDNIKDNLATVRNEYGGATLDVSTVCTDPQKQFERWMSEALFKEFPDPNAMILATASKAGQPSLRTVLLRDYNEKGFVFFTNYNSQKGKEIEENAKASVLFFWPKLMRQIKIEGVLVKIDPAQSEEYFKTRPVGNQIAAWASQQSSEIENKYVLEERYKALEEKYKGKEIPYPEFWGGFRLCPGVYEFWQGQPNRLHDRIRYELESETGIWKIKRLAP
jgi:pyridoxamine 5'-phosphate oxidase